MDYAEAVNTFSPWMDVSIYRVYKDARNQGYYCRRPRGNEFSIPRLANESFPCHITFELWREVPPISRSTSRQNGSTGKYMSSADSPPVGFPYRYKEGEKKPECVVAVHHMTDKRRPSAPAAFNSEDNSPQMVHALVDEDNIGTRTEFLGFTPVLPNDVFKTPSHLFRSIARPLPPGDEERRIEKYGHDLPGLFMDDLSYSHWPPLKSQCDPEFPDIPLREPPSEKKAEKSNKQNETTAGIVDLIYGNGTSQQDEDNGEWYQWVKDDKHTKLHKFFTEKFRRQYLETLRDGIPEDHDFKDLDWSTDPNFT